MSQEYFRVQGGHQLAGVLEPQGAKNEALQVLSAVLLTDEQVTLQNLPDILDVRKMISLLTGLGVKVNRISPSEVIFQSDEINLDYLHSDDYVKSASKIRGSVMLMGPILARYDRAFLPKPGGDKIGRRRLDTHFNAFKKLGAEFRFEKDTNHFYLDGSSLQGADILMDEISVTGTANILMAAVLAEGTTTIYNAACEPYLQQLSKMLRSMGADISGVGSNLLTITGVKTLEGTTHRILPDMIEIGSFIGLAAMTQSDIRIPDARIDQLGNILQTFRKIGITINEEGDTIHVPAQDRYEIETYIDGSILTVYDSPWPGFTPDLLSILLVVATQAQGSVLIHQKMFESRLFFVDKLIDMGAKIILCDPHRATVIGINREYNLRGITMSSPDIRAGVSLLIAALSAEGESIIHNISQIDRGYQNIDTRLQAIGAKIDRVQG